MFSHLKSLPNFFLIVFIGLLTAFIITLADWKAPSFTAPSCPATEPGCGIPLNTGPVIQTKTGGLNINGNVGIGTTEPVNKLDVSGDVALSGKHAFRSNDSWLRLNQDGAFVSGVHTPGVFAPVSLNVGGAGGWGNPGTGNVWITGNVGIGTTELGYKLDVREGRIAVGEAGNAYSYIVLRDDESPNGVKYIHANSNVVGFLSGAGSWLSYWDNAGNMQNIGGANFPGNVTMGGSLDMPDTSASNSSCMCTASNDGGCPYHKSASIAATCPAGYIAYSGACSWDSTRPGGANRGYPINSTQYVCEFSGSEGGSTCHSASFSVKSYCLKIQ